MIIYRGNSGCVIERKGDKVFKHSPNEKYNERLLKSYLKLVNDKSTIYKVPRCELHKNKIYTMEMDYIGGQSMVDFILEEPFKNGIWLIDKLIAIIAANTGLTDVVIHQDVFINKLKSIHMYHHSLDKWFRHGIILSDGKCHGDLTLSNMKIHDGNLYLFDHLDSYIESPVMDIIKLHQDLDFYWSLQYTNKHIPVEYFEVMTMMRIKLHQAFALLIDNTTYNMLQYINLARIFPYLKDQDMVKKLSGYMEVLSW